MKTENKKPAGRPIKNEINHRISLIITTKKLRDNVLEEKENTGLDVITIINKRLNKSYENR